MTKVHFSSWRGASKQHSSSIHTSASAYHPFVNKLITLGQERVLDLAQNGIEYLHFKTVMEGNRNVTPLSSEGSNEVIFMN